MIAQVQPKVVSQRGLDSGSHDPVIVSLPRGGEGEPVVHQQRPVDSQHELVLVASRPMLEVLD